MNRYLSGRFFVLLSLWLMIGILGMEFPFLLLIYLLLGAALFFLCIQDRRSLPKSGELIGSLSSGRIVELDKYITLEIVLEVHGTAGANPNNYQVALGPLERLRLKSRSSPCVAKWQRILTSNFELRGCQLGSDTVPGFFAETISSMGLWYGRVWVPTVAEEIHVIPSKEIIPESKLSELLSRQRLLLAGTRLRMRASSPDQYFSSRLYQYPDSIRFIDWKKSAKTGTMHTKQFDSLYRANVILAFDLGRTMLGQVRLSQKRDYYLAAGHLLAEYALNGGDSVSALGFSNRPLFSFPRITSPAQIDALGSNALGVVKEVATDYSVLLTEIPRLSAQRAIVIVFTDAAFPSAQEQLLPVIAMLSRKHMVVLLSMIDFTFHLPSRMLDFKDSTVDSESYLDYLYLYWLHDSFQAFAGRTDAVGAAALNVPEKYWLDVCGRVFNQLRVSTRL